jgi:hypothetical protein
MRTAPFATLSAKVDNRVSHSSKFDGDARAGRSEPKRRDAAQALRTKWLRRRRTFGTMGEPPSGAA